MAETRRKKRKPTQAVKKRRRQNKADRRSHRQRPTDAVRPRDQASSKVNPETQNPADVSHPHSGSSPGGGGGSGVSSGAVNQIAQTVGAAAGVGAHGGTHQQATQAAVEAFHQYAPAGQPTSTRTASQHYRHQLRQHRETMQAIQKQVKVVQQSSDKTRAAARKRLNKLLMKPSRARPEKPKDYTSKRMEAQGEKFFQILSGDPSEITRKLLGRSRLQRIEHVGDTVLEQVQDAAVRQRYGPPWVRKTEPLIKAIYRGGSPARRQDMRRAGLGPMNNSARAMYHGQSRHSTLMNAYQLRTSKTQYQRQQGRQTSKRQPVFQDYRALTEQQQEQRSRKARREALNVDHLMPHERTLANRAGRENVKRDLDRSRRALEMFGAFPAQGEKFQRALDRAITYGNDKQRFVAQVWVDRLEHADQQYFDSIDPGKGWGQKTATATTLGPKDDMTALALQYGLVKRHKGKLMLATGEDYGTNAWHAIKAKSDRLKEEEKHAHTPIGIAESALGEVKAVFDPETWRQLADVGIETISQLPQDIMHAATGNIPAADHERLNALMDQLYKTDAPVGAIQVLMEGGSVEDAVGEFKRRADLAPIATIGEFAAVARLLKVGGLMARYGTAGKSVEAARPGFKVFDMLDKKEWSTMSTTERLRAISARRHEARVNARKRAKDAKNAARDTNRRERRKARDAGEKPPPRVSASDVLRPAEHDPEISSQFYSAATPVRVAQKGREVFQGVTGRDPFNKYGRRAGGWFNSRVGGHFRRGANKAIPRLKASSLALGAKVDDAVRELVYRPARAGGVLKTNEKDVAAFVLRYDETVRPGHEVEDLGAAIEANQAYLNLDEMPPGAKHSLEDARRIAQNNIVVLEDLRDDLKYGPQAHLNRAGLVNRVTELRDGMGLSIDDAMVREGFVGSTAAAGRRAAAPYIGRGEIERVEKDQVLPGEVEKRETAGLELGVAKAENEVKKARKEAEEAAQPKKRRPRQEPSARHPPSQHKRDKAAKEKAEGPKKAEAKPQTSPDAEFVSTAGEGPAKSEVGDVGVQIRKEGHPDLSTPTGKAIIDHLKAEFKKGPEAFLRRVLGPKRKGDFDWQAALRKLSPEGRDELLKQMRKTAKIKAERARSPAKAKLWKEIEEKITGAIAQHAKRTRAGEAMPKQRAAEAKPEEKAPEAKPRGLSTDLVIQKALEPLGASMRRLHNAGKNDLKNELGTLYQELGKAAKGPTVGRTERLAKVVRSYESRAARSFWGTEKLAQALVVAAKKYARAITDELAKVEGEPKAATPAARVVGEKPKRPGSTFQQERNERELKRADESRSERSGDPRTWRDYLDEAAEARADYAELERQRQILQDKLDAIRTLEGRGDDREALRVAIGRKKRKLEKVRGTEHEATVVVRQRSKHEEEYVDDIGAAKAEETLTDKEDALLEARAKLDRHLETADNPVAAEIIRTRNEGRNAQRFLERQKRDESEDMGSETAAELHPSERADRQRQRGADTGQRVRERVPSDIVADLQDLQGPVPIPKHELLDIPERPRAGSDELGEALRGLDAHVQREELPESEGDYAAYQDELAAAHEKVASAIYRPEAFKELDRLEQSFRSRAWAESQDLEKLSPRQRAILKGMGIGVAGRRFPLHRNVLEAMKDEMGISINDLHRHIRDADAVAAVNAGQKAVDEARVMLERRLARGQKPQGEALDAFYEEVLGESHMGGNRVRAREFERALDELLKADEIGDLKSHREALRQVVADFQRMPVRIRNKELRNTHEYLARKVEKVAKAMVTERTALWTHEDASVAEATQRLGYLQRRRKAARRRMYQLMKEPMATAERDGWAWVKGPKLGQMFNETTGGAFIDSGAVDRRFSRGERKIDPDSSGPLKSADVLVLRDLTKSRTLQASFQTRVRLLGLMRMKNVLINMSPYKRAMTQEEAQELIGEIASEGGQPEFVMVPIGKGGSLSDQDLEGFVGGLTRAPEKGEPVVVVPKAIARVFNEVTRPPGRVRAVATYLSQKYVQAVLPFSVVWHAGNAVDLMTRLAVAGVNPWKDRTLARAFRQVMLAEDPVNGPEMFDYLVGHMGSREGVIRTATLGQAWAGGRSNFSNRMVELFDKMNNHRGVKLAQPLRYSSQKLFDFATFTEHFFVEHAMGSALRSMGRDLGYEIRDHVALAEKLVDEVHADPALLEEFGQRTLSIVGDYTASAFGQNVLQAIDPFWSWVRESAKFVFYTFPAKHPIKFALAATLAQAQEDVAERYGLDRYLDGTLGDLPQFLQGGFPAGTIDTPISGGMHALGTEASDGWFRPTSPLTSWGEAAKMLDNPLGYLAGRPFPYMQRALSVARGHRSYHAIGEYGLRNFQSWLGIDLPGFDPPETLPITEYTGNQNLGVLGELVKSFIPGANQVNEVMLRGSLGTQKSNIFQPDVNEAAAIDLSKEWWESRVINPFGKSRDLSAIGFEPKRDESIRMFGPNSVPVHREPHEMAPHKAANIVHAASVGDVMYTDRGNPLRWNGHRWVKGRPEGDARARPSQVKSKGSSKDISKPAKHKREQAIAALDRKYPQLNTTDPHAIDYIADAARKYDVPASVLGAIYRIESNYGTSPGITTSHDGGVLGPMQFQQATFDAYGVDADGKGGPDIQNTEDAIHSAANYLKANGGDNPDTLYDAIFAYNHADWYVQDVLGYAQDFDSPRWMDAGAGRRVDTGSATETVKKVKGAWGGARTKALQAIPAHAILSTGNTAREEARHDKRTPTENADAGGATDSDHLTTNGLAYAADMPGTLGDGHADELAASIADRLGMDSHTGLNETTIDGYRYQLIWQYEGHYDHVHLGVRYTGQSAPQGTYSGGPIPTTTTVAPSSSGAGYTVTGSGGGQLPPAMPMMHHGQQVVTGNPAIGAKLSHRWKKFEFRRLQLVMALMNDDIDELEFVTKLKSASGMVGI